MDQFVFINDRFVNQENASLPYRDLVIQRAYGIFDFFKVSGGQPLFLDDHLERFYFSAQQMRLPLNYQAPELKAIIDTLIKKNQIQEGGIRLTLTGGNSPDGYKIAVPNLVIAHHSFTPLTDEQVRAGIKLVSYEFQRQLPRVKSIDYIMAIWLQPMLKDHQADDVLYHQGGYVTECPRSNFFVVTRDEVIVTPEANLLKGITRSKVLELASGHFRVEERPLSIKEIHLAKEAFITSTTKMILPVRQIDDHLFTQSNSVTLKLTRLLNDRIGFAATADSI